MAAMRLAGVARGPPGDRDVVQQEAVDVGHVALGDAGGERRRGLAEVCRQGPVLHRPECRTGRKSASHGRTGGLTVHPAALDSPAADPATTVRSGVRGRR